jgi:hypothetical protein
MYPEPLNQVRHHRGEAVLFLLGTLRTFFIHWNRIHLIGGGPENVREVVSLMDRFLDGPRRYDVEWRDFLTWETENAAVEQVRKRIEAFAHLLFSNRPRDRDLFDARVRGERNRLAALLGVPVR